jgi:hypothetical protein
MNYCPNCGAPNQSPNAKFCGKCGASLTAATQATQPAYEMPPPPEYTQPGAQPAYAAPQGAERVFGVILLKKPKSLGRYDSFTCAITNQRMLFAQMTSQMLAEAASQARAQAKAEGKGFMGQWENQLRATFTFTQRYLTMEPAAILAETPGNFAVNNSTITEIKLNLKNINKGQQTHQHEFEVDIATQEGHYIYRMEEHDEFVKMLKQVYGERVKTPFGYFSRSFKIGV